MNDNEILAMEPAAVRQYVAWREAGSPKQIAELQAAVNQKRLQSVSEPKGVAIIPIFGAISRHPSLLMELFGGTTTGRISQQLHRAIADKGVGSILLWVDSPGGSVHGIQELAAEIRAARAQKRIVALADSFMASAAYWLGSQASEVVMAPSAMVGSIGALAVHEDYSRAEERIGIKTTLIASAPFKTELDSSRPLTTDATRHLQTVVNEWHRRFIEDITKGRRLPTSMVESSFGGGRMLMSSQALSVKMVDRVAPLAEVISRLLRPTGVPGSAGLAARRATPVTRAEADARVAQIRRMEINRTADRIARDRRLRSGV